MDVSTLQGYAQKGLDAIAGIVSGSVYSTIIKVAALLSIPLGLWLIARVAKGIIHSVRKAEAEIENDENEAKDTAKAHSENAAENAQASSDAAQSELEKWKITHPGEPLPSDSGPTKTTAPKS